MSDKVLKNAMAQKKALIERRLALHDEIARIDEQIGDVEAFIRKWHMFSEQEPDQPFISETDDQNKKETSVTPTRKMVPNSRKEDVAEAAREIIRQLGHPLRREDLYEALSARGLTIDGKDPLNVLTTMLWRMQHRVAKRPDGRYDLIENWSREAKSTPDVTESDDLLG